MLAGAASPRSLEIHQQKGEIVENVAGRDQRAELDRIEQHRPAFEQNDVAEMEIAVNAPRQAAAAALDQQRPNARIGGAAGARERFDLGCREELRPRAERRDVLLDISGERIYPGLGIDHSRAGMGMPPPRGRALRPVARRSGLFRPAGPMSRFRRTGASRPPIRPAFRPRRARDGRRRSRVIGTTRR